MKIFDMHIHTYGPEVDREALLAEMGAFVAPSKSDPTADSEQQCFDQAPLTDMP